MPNGIINKLILLYTSKLDCIGTCTQLLNFHALPFQYHKRNVIKFRNLSQLTVTIFQVIFLKFLSKRNQIFLTNAETTVHIYKGRANHRFIKIHSSCFLSPKAFSVAEGSEALGKQPVTVMFHSVKV